MTKNYQKPMWWARCPTCRLHLCDRDAQAAAIKLFGHLLVEHGEWIELDKALESLTDGPQLETQSPEVANAQRR